MSGEYGSLRERAKGEQCLATRGEGDGDLPELLAAAVSGEHDGSRGDRGEGHCWGDGEEEQRYLPCKVTPAHSHLRVPGAGACHAGHTTALAPPPHTHTNPLQSHTCSFHLLPLAGTRCWRLPRWRGAVTLPTSYRSRRSGFLWTSPSMQHQVWPVGEQSRVGSKQA